MVTTIRVCRRFELVSITNNTPFQFASVVLRLFLLFLHAYKAMPQDAGAATAAAASYKNVVAD